jgi:hypothetical protein
VIDQYTPHETRRHRKKVRAVLPLHVLRADQFQVGLVDERGWLERVARAFVPHVAPGDTPQLRMH